MSGTAAYSSLRKLRPLIVNSGRTGDMFNVPHRRNFCVVSEGNAVNGPPRSSLTVDR